MTECNNVQLSGPVGVKVYLSVNDLNALKLNPSLATSSTNSFVDVQSGNGYVAVNVPSGSLASLQPTSTPVAAIFVVDGTPPEVTENGFTEFDLDSGQFTVVFSEPMNANSITVPGALILQHAANVNEMVDSFQVLELESPPSNGVSITFTLPPTELNRLKLTPRVCSSIATCWITIEGTGSFITDMANNRVTRLENGLFSTQRYAQSFVDDTTGPLLEDFVLNMTSRQLILTFDEPVNVNTFNTSLITIQGSLSPTLETQYTLTSGVLLTDSGAVIVVLLSDEDVNALQSRPGVATSGTNTYISLQEGVALDLAYLQNPSRIVTKLATDFLPDLAPPNIRAFDLNLDDNTIVLVFSEPVITASVDPTRLTVQSQAVGGVSRQLMGGIVHNTPLPASAEIVVTLTNSDVTFLEVSQNIALSTSNTFLTVMAGLAVDTNIVTSSALGAIQARSIVLDTSPPRVTGFELDMNTGELVLIFDDVIIASTFEPSALTLQSELTASPLERYTLGSTNSNSSLSDGFQVVVTIGPADLNRIKQIRNLATQESNTYLTVAATVANDVNGVDVIAVTDGNSLLASSFTADITRPVLEGWTLDMNSDQIILTFSETVDITMFSPSEVTLVALPGSSDTFILSGVSDVVPSGASYEFAIHFSTADVNSIKVRTSLATSISTSYLSISANAIIDIDGNALIPIAISNALQARIFQLDRSDPILQAFSLDMNSGLLSLSFDETVNAATLNVSTITLVNRMLRYTSGFTIHDSSTSSSNGAVLEINILQSDLNGIKAISDLASSDSNTFVIVTPDTVEDMSGNLLTEITSGAALQVEASEYIADTTSPSLVAFDLNMSSEQIILIFSETMRATSLNPTQITIQNTPGGVGRSQRLTGGIGSLSDDTSILLQLTEEDANNLKLDREIATSTSNTFVSLTDGSIQDTAGNSLVSVAVNNARPVRTFRRDAVSPQLTMFSLNLTQRSLSLTFDETIDSGSFSIVSVALQDQQSNPFQSVTLSSRSTTVSTDDTVFVIALSDDDFNLITATFPLATMDTNTFIVLPNDTVLDTSGNPNTVIPSNNALQITSHVADLIHPTLENFDLDLNEGILTLLFSESVNVTTFDPTQITLQNALSNPTYAFSLTGGQFTLADLTTIQLTLSRNDLNIIKGMTGLASLASNTYLRLTSAAISDSNMNMVVSISDSSAEWVRDYTEDITSPVLVEFDLDYNSGSLLLYFDETVNQASLMLRSSITLHAASGGSQSVNQYTLTNSSSTSTGLTTTSSILLSRMDLNELKRLRICTQPSNCYLSATTGLVDDVEGNQNAVISELIPIQVTDYVPDDTNPEVIMFVEFNLDAGSFTLEFSETVTTASFDSQALEFHSSYSNATHIFRIEEEIQLSADGYIVTFQLSIRDLNRLKLNTESVHVRRKLLDSFLITVYL